MHALTYVLSIEIALTVTVLCREASREKRGEHRVRDLEELRNRGWESRITEERAVGAGGTRQGEQAAGRQTAGRGGRAARS